jgi:hypothetical protein
MKRLLQLLVLTVLVAIVLIPAMAQSAINVKVTWNKALYATSYRLQVSTVTTFATTVADTVLTDSTKTVNGLVPLTTYYWRVNATNSVGTSPWSATWSFTTAPAVPLAPVLVSPSNGAVGVLAGNVTMGWQRVYGASSYRLQLSTSPTFASLVYDAPGIASLSRTVTGVKTKTLYFWRLYAVVNGRPTTWSCSSTFRTA